MAASAALTRSTPPLTPTSAMPMGARSKAISKRRSASRPARSAQRCSVTSRETKTIPSIVPSWARTGALWTTMVRREIGPNVSTLPSWPASAPVKIGSVAASSSAGTISDRWRPTIAAPSTPARLQVCARQQQAAQVQVEQADRGPGQVLQHEPMAALESRRPSSATRRALACPAPALAALALKTENTPW